MPSPNPSTFEILPNPYPDREYRVFFEIPEFTCLCPRTGQPDFATIRIWFKPAASLVELKSLKQYIWGYRQVGIFHEAVVNKMRDDLVEALKPRFLKIEGDFNVRGGIHTIVQAVYKNPEYKRPGQRSRHRWAEMEEGEAE